MPNVIYQLQIKIKRFFTVPTVCIENDQNILYQPALKKVQLSPDMRNFFEINIFLQGRGGGGGGGDFIPHI